MKQFLTAALTCALAAASVPAASALGGVTASGAVWTNQAALPSGSSVYPGDEIRTAEDAFAVLDSPATGRLELRGGTLAKVGEQSVALERGVIASQKLAVELDDLEIAARDPDADNWFVVENQQGRRLVAAYRGDVVIRGASAGAIVVPAGSYAMAAAAPAPRQAAPNRDAKKSDGKDDKDKKRRGGAAGAGAKSGWAIGNLSHAASVAVVTGVTAAALGGAVAAGAFRDDSASPKD